jgi:hypothetical protein
MADKLKEFESRFDLALGAEEKAARKSRKDLDEFDPFEAVGTSARAGFETFRDDFSEFLRDFRGQQVGSGRLDTGFAVEDEDRVLFRGLQDLNRQIAGQALGASSLKLSAISRADQSRDRFLDLLSGGLDREQAKKNAKFGADDFFSSVLPTVGAALPFI